MISREKIDFTVLNLESRFTEPVKCFCGECEEQNNYYECKGCSRIVPWCFGYSDEWWEYCDDCYCVIISSVEKA